MANTATDTERHNPGSPAGGGPAKLPATSWLAAARRTIREYSEDNLSDRAAGLTYYAVMSIFPAALRSTAASPRSSSS